MRRSLVVVAGLLLAFTMPEAAPAQSDEPAVLEGEVRQRLVLDEAFVKSLPAITIDVTFETDKESRRAAIPAFSFGPCWKMPALWMTPARTPA
jgi:hypothetical protein